jgi:DNA-binding response OmpR family regulator
LVVDDSVLIRNAVRRFLESAGYRVVTATDGLEGLSTLDRIAPSLVITNWIMPKMSGSEFIREVRHRSDLARVPIIAVVGRRSSGATIISGADHVAYKEIDLVEQLQSILKLLGSTKTPEVAGDALSASPRSLG